MATSLKWCCNQKEGIKLIEPNENLASGYLEMAEKAIGTMIREKNLNLQFAISAGYYSMYYSLYAVLMKIGIKCEIHTCTLEFMKELLKKFYSKGDSDVIKKAFNTRNTSQYYVDRIIAKEDIESLFSNALPFLNKSKNILEKINENDILKIRKEIEKVLLTKS